jgi:hypothetical protein
MVPASSVRNYILEDPLLDFLKEYNIHSLKDKPSKIPNLFDLEIVLDLICFRCSSPIFPTSPEFNKCPIFLNFYFNFVILLFL